MATYTGIASLTIGNDTLELASSSGEVEEIREALSDEISNRSSADAALQSAIDAIPDYSLSTSVSVSGTVATINITLNQS